MVALTLSAHQSSRHKGQLTWPPNWKVTPSLALGQCDAPRLQWPPFVKHGLVLVHLRVMGGQLQFTEYQNEDI